MMCLLLYLWLWFLVYKIIYFLCVLLVLQASLDKIWHCTDLQVIASQHKLHSEHLLPSVVRQEGSIQHNNAARRLLLTFVCWAFHLCCTTSTTTCTMLCTSRDSRQLLTLKDVSTFSSLFTNLYKKCLPAKWDNEEKDKVLWQSRCNN